MGLFGKKGPSREELIAQAAELNENPAEQKQASAETSVGDQKVDIELTKIKGRIEGLDEVRKANSERFSRVAEQVGELRGMIMDTNKAMSKVEVSATKAVDLVESVHPEKLMIEVRKQDGKIESVRAQIESSEAIMKDMMLEMKKMREKMNFYKGIEQVIALNDEVKQELATIKKVEATIERHADKVETIFVEVEKKFSEFDKFNDVVKDLDASFKKLAGDFEKVRAKVELKLERKEFVDLLNRFNEFEKHSTNLMKLLDERNKTVSDDLEKRFKRLVKEYQGQLDRMKPPKGVKLVETPEETADDAASSGEDNAAKGMSVPITEKLKGLFKKDGEKKEAAEESLIEEPKLVAQERERQEKDAEEKEKQHEEEEKRKKEEAEKAAASEGAAKEAGQRDAAQAEGKEPAAPAPDATSPAENQQAPPAAEGAPDEKPQDSPGGEQPPPEKTQEGDPAAGESENDEKSDGGWDQDPQGAPPPTAGGKPKGRFEEKGRFKK